jgi:hypothetical protein
MPVKSDYLQILRYFSTTRVFSEAKQVQNSRLKLAIVNSNFHTSRSDISRSVSEQA